MIEVKDGYTRVIEFSPAWDRSHPDPKKDYGISDVEMVFGLFRDDKGIEFSVSTNWHLPHVFNSRMLSLRQDIMDGKEAFLWSGRAKEFLMEVCLYDLNHVQREDDEWILFSKIRNGLKYLKQIWDTDHVHYFWLPDLEHAVWDKFLTKGEEAMWKELTKIYKKNFE
jgi:hypothetical protein